jgi:hypothetical protein
MQALGSGFFSAASALPWNAKSGWAGHVKFFAALLTTGLSRSETEPVLKPQDKVLAENLINGLVITARPVFILIDSADVFQHQKSIFDFFTKVGLFFAFKWDAELIFIRKYKNLEILPCTYI